MFCLYQYLFGQEFIALVSILLFGFSIGLYLWSKNLEFDFDIG